MGAAIGGTVGKHAQRLLDAGFRGLKRVLAELLVARHRELSARSVHAGYGKQRQNGEQQQADHERCAFLPGDGLA